MIKKLLIANRGEIALRILRACRLLNIQTVAVYTQADADLMHVKLADESVCIGKNSPLESYLNPQNIIAAAELTQADAIHPGYGFLSEQASFAKLVSQHNMIFVGPSAEIIDIMGDKMSAINTMKSLGIPCVPGSDILDPNDPKALLATAESIGYPVLIKASAGGGGRGMRVVKRAEDLLDSINLTRMEAQNAFGCDAVYMEKYLNQPRHIEIQVASDQHGNVIYFPERDCSIQRRHQKIIEESPGFKLSQKERKTIGKACVKACQEMGYNSLGTFEFLYEDGAFYFIEMNTRIQVEHPASEMVTGIDCIALQINIAQGNPLSIKQNQVHINGHAIECRINAEDPKTFQPSPGKITFYHAPGGPGIRVDSHAYSGYTVPHYYDSLLAKVIAHGSSREEARLKMKQALKEIIVEGIKTNIDTHQTILDHPDFTNESIHIKWLDDLNSKKS
ncbi:MAG: acetyl-CoA carboxylase biotin carboxylase subunit [Candidatus Comchoanobacterales bacterium]